VTFFQQNESVLIDVARVEPCLLAARIGCRHRKQKRVVEQRDRLDIAFVHRQCKQHRVERAASELIHQRAGLSFTQLDAQIRKALLQRRQDLRQHVRRKRRDDAEPQPAGQRARAMAGVLGEIVRRRQHASRPARNLQPCLGQHDVVPAPLDQVDAEFPLKLADLHRERRLRHGAGFGSLAEVPALCEGGQIPQLSQGDHPIR
jgi:hypothetical protein